MGLGVQEPMRIAESAQTAGLPSGMPRHCVCYTPDQSYLFPTFVSAVQARRHTSRHLADIVIIAFGIDPVAAAVFAEACARADIRFMNRSEADIHGAPAMLARLFLAELLPEHYEYFLYVDGDTQVEASLDDLLTMHLPHGMFRAAADPMTFACDDTDRHGRGIAAHFASLGLSPSEARRYFNTGVIHAERQGWARIGAEAWKLFSGKAGSRFPDQDVLNLVGLPYCLPMSLAWNFPAYMYNARVASLIGPRIVHYMAQPKPWNGAFPPWNHGGWKAYGEVAARFPETAPYWRRNGRAKWVRYHLQQRYRRVTETFTWALSVKRERILAYERGLKQVESAQEPPDRARSQPVLAPSVGASF